MPIPASPKSLDASSERSWTLDRLPQRLPGGAFECLYCDEPTVHQSRDRLLVHISESHPNVDFDTVEEFIPARMIHSLRPMPDIVTFAVPIAPKGPAQSVTSAPKGPVQSVTSSSSSSTKAIDVVFSDDCFPCELCGRQYGCEADLLRHLETLHPDGTASGVVDGGEDETLRQMQKEEMKARASAEEGELAPESTRSTIPGVSPAMAVVCDLCATGQGKVFSSTSALFAHIKSKHVQHSAADHTRRMVKQQDAKKNGVFACGKCSKVFSSAAALEGHYDIKHGEGSVAVATPAKTVAINQAWWCHDCERGFASPQGLHGHMTTKHDLPSAPFPCPACKRIFSDVYSLKTHITLQHKNLDAAEIKAEDHCSCTECMRQFIGEKNLDLHWKKHHKTLGERPKIKSETTAARPTRVAALKKKIQTATDELESVLTHDITSEASSTGQDHFAAPPAEPTTPSELCTENSEPTADESNPEPSAELPRARVVVRRKLREEATDS